jgi:hypothetical protein
MTTCPLQAFARLQRRDDGGRRAGGSGRRSSDQWRSRAALAGIRDAGRRRRGDGAAAQRSRDASGRKGSPGDGDGGGSRVFCLLQSVRFGGNWNWGYCRSDLGFGGDSMVGWLAGIEVSGHTKFGRGPNLAQKFDRYVFFIPNKKNMKF